MKKLLLLALLAVPAIQAGNSRDQSLDSDWRFPPGDEAGRKERDPDDSAWEQFIEVRLPKLWSPASPDLYSAEVEVMIGGKTVDTVSTPFGIPKIEVDARRGFRLNGGPIHQHIRRKILNPQ